MNARQAARAAAKKIEELENFNARSKADITVYNHVILQMIDGKSPCPWCEENKECQLEAKDGKGCQEWWLAYETIVEEDQANDSEGLPVVGSEGRA